MAKILPKYVKKSKSLVRPEHVDDQGVVGGVVAADEESSSKESRKKKREAGDERHKESEPS